MKYYTMPKIWWHWPLFIIGFVFFWVLVPIWILCAILWWKEDTAFLLPNLQGLFYNPWEFWS